MSTHATHVFGAQHAEIAELLTDTPAGTTYAAALDVPGLKSVSVSTSSNSVELRGDNQLLAKETVVQSIEVTLEFAKWDAEVYALITGATFTPQLDPVTQLPTGNYSVSNGVNDEPKAFSLRALSASATGTGSEVGIFFPQLKITNLPDMVGLSEEEFKTVSVTCEAIPTATGDWFLYDYTA